MIGLLKRVKFFSTLWLIRSANSIKTFFTVIIGKNFSADFDLKTGVREFFLTLFNWSSEKNEVFSSLWLIKSGTSIQTVFLVIIGKTFSADFHLNTGVRGLFLTFFLGLLKRVKFFWSLWIKRIATSIQTVFTVIIGKNFSADFHLKTGVREHFLTLFNLSSERVKFFHPYD